jgi:hypothetical protein
VNIADLFVNLGIKGTETTTRALTGVKDGLGDIASTSLAAKAGILAVMYGLEQMMAHSAAQGNSLVQFSQYTGMSADALQRWQYLLRQSGVGAGEAEGSLKALQKTMYLMKAGLAAPSGMNQIQHVLGMSPADMQRAQEDTEFMMEKLREYAKLQKDLPRGNMDLQSMGLSEGMILALRTSKVDLGKVPSAYMYSEGQEKSLQKIGVAWDNLGSRIAVAFGKMNAKHGGNLVGEIGMIADKVMHLIESLVIMSEKLKIFELIGKAFEGWGMILDGINSTADKLANKDKHGKPVNGTAFENIMGKLFPETFKSIKDNFDTIQEFKEKERQQEASKHIQPNIKKHQLGGKTASNVSIDLDMNFQHEGKNAQQTAGSLKQAINEAFFSNPNLVQG